MPDERKRPTIVDVARAAGTSVGSVSNVINRTRPVSDELRDQVLSAADRLGYQVNSLARTLRNRRSNLIGLCTPDTTSAYLNDLANELDKICAVHGYELLNARTRQNPETELQRVRSLLSRQADGLILLPSLEPQAALDAMHAAGIPAVIVDREVDDPRFCYVTLDNYSAMRQLVRSFVTLGHRNLLFIVRYLKVITTQHRIAGLRDEAREPGREIAYDVIERGDDIAAFQARLQAFFDRPERPTAIVMGNSIIAVSTMRALRELGVRCPEHVALATFDDPEWAVALTPPLTTVRTPTADMARAVWELLHAQIEGTLVAPRSVQIKTAAVFRSSSQQAPHRDNT